MRFGTIETLSKDLEIISAESGNNDVFFHVPSSPLQTQAQAQGGFSGFLCSRGARFWYSRGARFSSSRGARFSCSLVVCFVSDSRGGGAYLTLMRQPGAVRRCC